MLRFGLLLLCTASGRPGGGMCGAAAGKGLRLTAVSNH